jgi:hypothetical protein
MIFVRVKIKVTRDFFVIPLTRRSYFPLHQCKSAALKFLVSPNEFSFLDISYTFLYSGGGAV